MLEFQPDNSQVVLMSDNVCEICGAASATEEGFWDLCLYRDQLYLDFVGWLRYHPHFNANDIQAFKQLIRREIRKGATKSEIFATLNSIVQR